MDMNIKIHLETSIKYKIKKKIKEDVLGLNVHPFDRLRRKQSYSLS